MKKATFAAGCFWGVEHYFRQLEGVIEAQVGYTGGTVSNPDYRTVCGGATGHAEAVELEFDPEKISYGELLKAFFQMHDATQLNRQGPDVGTQYRSAVFYHDEDQKEQAEQLIEALNQSGALPRPVVTQVVPSEEFFRAEEYHQRYIEKKGGVSCHL